MGAIGRVLPSSGSLLILVATATLWIAGALLLRMGRSVPAVGTREIQARMAATALGFIRMRNRNWHSATADPCQCCRVWLGIAFEMILSLFYRWGHLLSFGSKYGAPK